MTKPQTNPSTPKNKSLVFLEYVLLAVCLCVMALRTTYTEGPALRSSILAGNFSNNLYSLSVSAFLIFSFVLWFVWSFLGKKFVYRLTGIEIGLCIFCIAAIVASFTASEKRLAITDVAVSLAPVLMALLLVQILDSPLKVKLVLAAIVALGVLSSCQCAEQFFASNEMTIEQYEQDPQTMLEPLGIESGTFKHFLFEHRLYSRGVRAFFTTRNSAGSFLLIGFFSAIALFIDKFKKRKSDSSRSLHILIYGMATAVVLFGLALTRSKGAIIGFHFATVALIALLYFGNWLKAHKKVILVACLILFIAGGWVVVLYGLNHGRLPGGSSMLVRWQYWHASAKMYADHPLTGVGPGNFTHFYTHYKPAAALESVSDPHNFPLSILTQYGPLGLIGFLTMVFIPLWKLTSLTSETSNPTVRQPQSIFRTQPIVYLLIMWVVLLLARQIVIPATATGDLMVVIYVILRFYIPYVVAFAVALLLLTAKDKTRATSYEPRVMNMAIVLACALLGVIFHNLIDFAIFEPGVFTTFWVIIACIISLNYLTHPRPELTLKSAPFVRVLGMTVALIVSWAYFSYALIPVAKSTNKIQQSHQATSIGHFERAHNLLDKAAQDDLLSHEALSLNGRLYLYRFEQTQSKNRDLLLRAEKCLQAAIERNNAAYNNFERLTEVYYLLAEISAQQEKNDWLYKALNTASLAIERYPGCGRLHLKLAQIAEQLEKTGIALEHYKKAIVIEDKYRAQFQIMYPERKEFVSRLGEEKYRLANERIEKLSEKNN